MAVVTETVVTREIKKGSGDEYSLTKPLFLALLLALVAAGAVYYYFFWSDRTVAVAGTEYQSVLLDNGSAYFGKIIERNSEEVVLQDVYYVQTTTNAQTKQVSNVLIKRGKEWHAPDRMVINRQHLVYIEPVAPDSKVAKLIEESKRK